MPSPKPRRVAIPAEVRQYILQRDRHQCQHCGSSHNLELDHIIPIAQGGTNDLSNLQVLCLTCNRDKKAKTDPKSHRKFTL